MSGWQHMFLQTLSTNEASTDADAPSFCRTGSRSSPASLYSTAHCDWSDWSQKATVLLYLDLCSVEFKLRADAAMSSLTVVFRSVSEPMQWFPAQSQVCLSSEGLNITSLDLWWWQMMKSYIEKLDCWITEWFEHAVCHRGELLPIVPSDSLSLFFVILLINTISVGTLFKFFFLVASSQTALHSVFIYTSHSVSLSLFCRLGSISLTFIHELFINLSVEAVALEEIHEVTKPLWIIILSSRLVWSHNVLIVTIVSSAALSQQVY